MKTTTTDKLSILLMLAAILLLFGALFPAHQVTATDEAKAVFGVA